MLWSDFKRKFVHVWEQVGVLDTLMGQLLYLEA